MEWPFSKFCQLRSKLCIPVTAAGANPVCVCQQHQNAKLVVLHVVLYVQLHDRKKESALTLVPPL